LASNFAGDSDQSPPTGAITLSDGSASGLDDRYNGKANFEAQYINLDMQLLDTLRFNLGTRRERSLIEVRDSSGQLFRNGPDEPESKKLRTDQLTSFSITWDFYPNMIFRAAYSETLNRPILREIAPVRLFNPGDGRFYVGNPSLVTAEIENFDLRYEMYFGENDYFSLSAFKKNIDQPIETFARETTEEIFAFGWQNSAFAVNEGLEFEVRKYMTPSFYLTANATFIDSKVVDESDLKNSLERSGITERSLTGVSEELINTQFVYDRGGFQGSLSYNRYSERVFGLILSPTGSTTSLVVEQPFTSVDANVKYSLDTKEGVIKVGVKVANLLDEPIVRTVKNLGDLPYETYDVGQTYGLSIEWKH